MSFSLLRCAAIALLASTVLTGGCATTVATSGKVVVQDRTTRTGIVITRGDRRIIRKHFAQHRSRQKKKELPPGLASPGQGLAHGLAKRDKLPTRMRLRNLPLDLDHKLTSLPREYMRIIVGNDVAIINRKTRVVIDIARDVVVY